MFMRKIIALLLTMVMLVGVLPMGTYAANLGAGVVLNSFANGGSTNLVNEGWVSISDSTAATISKDYQIVNDMGYTNVLKFGNASDTNGIKLTLSTPVTHVEGTKTVVSLKMRSIRAAANSSGGRFDFFQGRNSVVGIVQTRPDLNGNGQMFFSGKTSQITATCSTDGTVYHDIRLVYDLGTKTFDAFYDGIKVNDTPLQCAGNQIDWLRFYDETKTSTNYIRDLRIVQTPGTVPTAENPQISGNAEIGQTVTGNYTFTDVDESATNIKEPEGDSVYTWYTCDENGENEEVIAGETSKTLMLTSDYDGKYLKFSVTPKDIAGFEGANVKTTEPFGPVAGAKHQIENVVLSKDDNTLKVTQTYDGTNALEYAWERSENGKDFTAFGSNSSTYTMVKGDDVYHYRVTVSAVDSPNAVTSAVYYEGMGNEIMLDDNFAAMPVGAIPTDYVWLNEPTEVTNENPEKYVGVVNWPDADKKALRIFSPNKADMIFKNLKTKVSGIVTAEIELCKTVDRGSIQLRLLGGGLISANLMINENVLKYYTPSTGWQPVPDVPTLTAGEYVKLKMVLDYSDKTYELYVNDVSKGTFGFNNSNATCLDDIRIEIPNRNDMSVYVDHIKVYNEISKGNPTDIDIAGRNTIQHSVGTISRTAYTAALKDGKGNIIYAADKTPVWSLQGTPDGVAIDANTGVITVQPGCTAQNITVVATSGSIVATKDVSIAVDGNYLPRVSIYGMNHGQTINLVGSGSIEAELPTIRTEDNKNAVVLIALYDASDDKMLDVGIGYMPAGSVGEEAAITAKLDYTSIPTGIYAKVFVWNNMNLIPLSNDVTRVSQ